jgi:hypothetical protein
LGDAEHAEEADRDAAADFRQNPVAALRDLGTNPKLSPCTTHESLTSHAIWKSAADSCSGPAGRGAWAH